MTYRVIDMFAGIGGFSLGLHRTGGFETVAFAEIEPYAARVLAERFPGVPNIGDVTTAEFPDADFICAGFPCQDISFAGAGAGLAGERSGLWREVVRALRVVRPRGALLENVAALLGRGLDTVLGDMAEIGYDAEWHCIPASAVGAPHRRDRIWIFANPGSEQHESSRAPISGEIGAELSRANAEGERCGEAGQFRRDEPAQWPASMGETIPDAAGDGWIEGQSNDAGRDAGTGPRPQLGLGDDSAPLADSIGIGQQGPQQPVNACHSAAHGEGQAGDAVNGRLGNQWAVEPAVGRVANGVPARVDRLRCLGNAVVPQVVELIGRAILASEEKRAA